MNTVISAPVATPQRTPVAIPPQGKGFSVFIPDGDSPFSIMVAQCLKRAYPALRIETGFTDRGPVSRWSRFVDLTIPLAKDDLAGSISQVLHRGRHDLLLPVSGPGIGLVGRHREEFSRITHVALLPSPENTELVNDKWAFAQALQRWGIPTPRTVLFHSPEDLEVFAADTPLIAKPRSGSGGKGIRQFPERDALLREGATFMAKHDPYIVQEYLPGTDIDRSVLADGGEVFASAIQQAIHAEPGFAPSSALRFLHDARVNEVTDRMFKAMHYDGVAHVDLRYAERTGELVVLEINPRYWATMYGAHSAGINFPMLHLMRSLGHMCTGEALDGSVYVGMRDWPKHLLISGLSLRRTSIHYSLADPLPKLLGLRRLSTAFGTNIA